MKRSLMGLFGCLLATSAMAQGPVYSVNIVGFGKQTLERNKQYMVSTAFADINGNPALTANDVFGSQLPVNAQIIYFDGVPDPSPYTILTRAGFGANNGWATNLVFQGFMGFWVKIPNTAVPATQTVWEVVLKGEVPDAGSVSNLVKVGLNQLGYPYTADLTFSNSALFGLANVNVQLIIWNPATTNYVGGIYTKPGFGTWAAGPVVIKLGQGFWFKRVNGTNFTYTENRPYPAP